MKQSTAIAGGTAILVAFLGGAFVATAILIGPIGLRVPSRGAVASRSPVQTSTSTPVKSPLAKSAPASTASMAFDEARGQLVAFDGQTWTWDGSLWTLKHPAASPPGRVGAAITYDPDHRLVLLWGGFANAVQSSDFWSWDGSSWTLVQTALFPPANGTPGWSVPSPVLLYDSQRHLVVLIRNNGSHPAAPSQPDVWTWDGAAWTHEVSTNVPAIWGTATYDPALGGILFFGVDGYETSQTWSYIGGSWAQLPSTAYPAVPMDNPPALTDFAPSRTAVLVDNSGQVWSWLNDQWLRQPGSATTAALGTYATAFDSLNRRLVLLANGTYTWDGSTWTRAA